MAPLEVERGEVIFAGVADMQPTTVNGVQTFWLRPPRRGAPRSSPDRGRHGARQHRGPGRRHPDQAFANLDNNNVSPPGSGQEHPTFGNEPKIDHCLYLSSQETFSQQGVQVEIDFNVSDPDGGPAGPASDDMIPSWSTSTARSGASRQTTPRGKAPAGWEQTAPGFVDGTNAFTKSGTVSSCAARPGGRRGDRRAELWSGAYRARRLRHPRRLHARRRQVGSCDERSPRPPVAFKSIGIRYQTSLTT